MSTQQKDECHPALSNGDDTSNLTPEQAAERRRRILQAMRNYRVELGNAKLAANPGLERVH